MRLAGIDINCAAIRETKAKLPDADIRWGFGYQLPFESESFEYVTCIEVIEHVPAQHRPVLLSEMRRVLVPGGHLVLRCPHAGIFDWLDAQNLRFRFPRTYEKLVGKGNRDANYDKVNEDLVWHHHFTREELIDLAGRGWSVKSCEFGGLILFPVSDILRWPFYRANRWDHWIPRMLEKIASAELSVNFGRSSYGILLVLRKEPVKYTRPPVPEQVLAQLS